MYTSLYVTAADVEEARHLATAAVEAGLAACANIFPIESIYRWEDELCHDEEYALLFKTRSELVEKLMDFLDQLHSYEIPCMVALPWEKAHPDYARWVSSRTATLTAPLSDVEGGGEDQNQSGK